MPTDSNPLLSVSEVASRLAVSACWVRRHRGKLGVIYLGRSLRFDPRAVEKVCTSSKSQPIVTDAGAPPKPESEMVMLRRYQRGSVYKIGKRIKVWYGMFRIDQHQPEGGLVRLQRNVRLGTTQELPTKNAAREALQKFLGVERRPSTRMTFTELVERWTAAQVPAMKSSTAQHYEHALRGLLPVFGDVEVSTLRRHDVERFIQDRAKKYSRSTLRSWRTTLSLVLGYAVDHSWLEKNPVKGVKLPRTENCAGRVIDRAVLTPSQVKSLADGLAEPYATLVLLLATTGLRIGEAAGLRWADLCDEELHIRRRIYSGKVDDLKTKNSRRQLPLSSEMIHRLRTLRRSEQDGWIFQASNGSPLNPGNWLRRELRPVATEKEIRFTGWHDFRHFFATRLRRGGAHPKVVSDLLGHAGVMLAMEVYDHPNAADLAAPVHQVLCDVMKSAASC